MASADGRTGGVHVTGNDDDGEGGGAGDAAAAPAVASDDAHATSLNVIYALDFDGVLCDTVGESSVSAFFAAQVAFPDVQLELEHDADVGDDGRWSIAPPPAADEALAAERRDGGAEEVQAAEEETLPQLRDVGDLPIPDRVYETRAPDWLVADMRALRPVIETGYENVLLVRLLVDERRRRRQLQRRPGGVGGGERGGSDHHDGSASIDDADVTLTTTSSDVPPMSVRDIRARWQRSPGQQSPPPQQQQQRQRQRERPRDRRAESSGVRAPPAVASDLRTALLRHYGVQRSGLVRLFGRVRDRWIERDERAWLAASRVYPGVADALNFGTAPVYIVSTKQERFVARLLAHAGVRDERVHRDRVYGLESLDTVGGGGGGGGTKVTVLKDILTQWRARMPGLTVHFVEDRVEALESATLSLLGAPVKYYLATWGYNDEAQRARAERNPLIQLLDLDTFVMRLR